jgi:multicomponent Na+:H+ antiporter subunit E
MLHSLALSAMLCGFWLINSGFYTPLMLFFMVLSVGFVVALCRLMDVVDGESQPLNLTFSIFPYWVWLIRQTIIANIDVARLVWRGPTAISPRVITVKALQKTDLGIVIFANSITLTPGTLSIDINGDEITVYALNKESAEDVLGGEMNRRVARMER